MRTVCVPLFLILLLAPVPVLAGKPAPASKDTSDSEGLILVPYERLKKGSYREVLRLLDENHVQEAYQAAQAAYRADPSVPFWWPIVASASLQKGKAEEALNLFRKYLEILPSQEKGYYEDLTLVAGPEEIERYHALPEEGRRDFLTRFWMQRDPTLVTAGASRQAEHYRRVWYSRTFFSRSAVPFDRRGEIYVRYGEPDWRARRGGPNVLPSPAVSEFRERLATILYGRIPMGQWIASRRDFQETGTFTGPIYPIQSDLTRPMDSANQYAPGTAGDMDFGFHRYKPVLAGFDVSAVKWESWVYTKLGNGVEIDFTDEMRTGKYDYAPIPTMDREDYHNPSFGARDVMSGMQLFMQFAPERVMKAEIAKTPERYDPVFKTAPLNFYYATADFRGAPGATAFELYAAIPFEQVGVPYGSDIQVECRVALLSPSGRQAMVATGTASASGSQWSLGGMLLHQARLEAPPGSYRLAVQTRSPDTDRTSIYSQEITLEPYGRDTLQISDVQIARDVTPVTEPGKFVKNGLRVTPLPTAAIRFGEKVFVYFEVYNLARDASGQTRYRVSYAVNTSGQSIAAKILSGLGRIVGASSPGSTASVVFEQSGTKDWEPNYVEMDLGPTRTGEHAIRVSVTDQNTGRTATKESKFKVLE